MAFGACLANATAPEMRKNLVDWLQEGGGGWVFLWMSFSTSKTEPTFQYGEKVQFQVRKKLKTNPGQELLGRESYVDKSCRCEVSTLLFEPKVGFLIGMCLTWSLHCNIKVSQRRREENIHWREKMTTADTNLHSLCTGLFCKCPIQSYSLAVFLLVPFFESYNQEIEEFH